MSDFKKFENELIENIARVFEIPKKLLSEEPPAEIVIKKTAAIGPTTFLSSMVVRRGAVD